jgi:glycosyltransferase involved in cell wall biosynthesis
MQLSIVTPCLNAAHYIQRCMASVADQKGVEFEHIVQDGGSTDGTLEILKSFPSVRFTSEPDTGMYDALNKGFDKATGDVFAHINADEQYLPGALQQVATFFSRNPDVDILFTDVLILRDDASFVCYQKVVKPTRDQTLLAHLPTYTAGTFFRRRVWEDGCRFDATKKALGDSWWMLRALDVQYRMACRRCYTTIVTATDENLSLSAVAREESQELFNMAGRFLRLRWLLLFVRYRATKLLRNCYWQPPFSYSVYATPDLTARQTHQVRFPTPFWMQMRKLKSLDYYTTEQ